MEEKIIGTWIDGKPLYESTIITQITASTNGTDYGITKVDVSNFNFETIVKMRAYLVHGDIESQYNANMCHLTHWSANLGTYTILYESPPTIRVRTTSTEWGGDDVYITLRYTKTTD